VKEVFVVLKELHQKVAAMGPASAESSRDGVQEVLTEVISEA
jgi:hypothetical protein